MSIAFYAPLKSPDHPVPSGDRLMARQLMSCLGHTSAPLNGEAGCCVQVASSLRAFLKDPDNLSELMQLQQQATREEQRLAALWENTGPPRAWFCYHPYYKSPDLIGPSLCRRFGVPYITAEASYSTRRNHGNWATLQQHVLASINQAAVNICFTQRDRKGLEQAAPDASLADLTPFIDVTAFTPSSVPLTEARLVTVAMMRRGDKMESYVRLAAALERLQELPWTLSVVGDGEQHDEVRHMFSRFPAERISWHGQLCQEAIAERLSYSSLYVWPGCGEAYGLAYLEAQASGLPVIAYRTAGVPEVVRHGYSGLLTPLNDDKAFADAIGRLITDENERAAMARQACELVRTSYSCVSATNTLRNLMKHYAGIDL